MYALYKAHPEYEYAALVRTKEKGTVVEAAYPRIRLVYGTLDDAELLEEESRKADIVLRKSQRTNLQRSCLICDVVL